MCCLLCDLVWCVGKKRGGKSKKSKIVVPSFVVEEEKKEELPGEWSSSGVEGE